MKKYLVIAAVAFAALVSCNKEISNEQMPVPSVKEGYVEITLSAGMDASTKAILDEKTVLWAVGDEVAVYPDAATTAEKFTVKTVEGKNVTITGSVPAGTTSLVAVYPYDSSEGRDGNTVKVHIPSTQDIPEGGTIDPAAMCSAAVYTDLSQTAQFQNLFSLLTFNVGDVTDANIVGLYATGLGAAIAGSFNASLTSDGPVLTPVTGSVGEFVKVFAEEDKFFAKKTQYYAVVAPCVVEGFTAGVRTVSKLGTVTSEKTLNLERNKGVNLGDVSSKVAFKYYAIHNADELQEFLAGASAYTAADVVELANDIDMSGVTLEPYAEGACSAAESFAGVFDGKNYSIKNWTTEGVSLFKTVTGTVKNVTIDATCSITKGAKVFTAFIAQTLEGSMENCHNKAPVTIALTDTDVTEDGIRIGSLAGRMDVFTSQMTDCSNSGDVTATVVLSADMSGTLYMGGLVGIVQAPGTEKGTRLLRCSNTGKVSVATSSTNAAEQWLSTHYVGGIAGASSVHAPQGESVYMGNVDSCVNEGDVTATWTGGSGGYFKVGGILGYSECAIVGCTNKGAISYTNSGEATNAGPSVGGIAAVLAGPATINAKDCVNEGAVSLSGVFTNAGSGYNSGLSGTTWATCGGCFGTVGDNTVLVDNCDNKGEVTVDAKMPKTSGSASAFGGVIGVSRALVTNCDNTGETTISGMSKDCHMGGVVGYTFANISNCSFGAPLKTHYDVTGHTGKPSNEYYNNVGGIVGYAVKDVVTSVSNCSVTDSGSIDVESNGVARVGGIVGMSYTPVDGCTNSGSIKFVPLDERPRATEEVKLSSYIGGIVGFQCNASDETKPQTVSNCINNGSLDVTMSSTFDTNHQAGIVANCYGALTDNRNTGSIKLKTLDGSKTASRVGGVVGTQYKDKPVSKCSNEGDLDVKMAASSAKSFVSGVIGWCGCSSVSSCTNSGDIVFDGGGMTTQMYVTGITSWYNLVTSFSDLSNSGDITVANWNNTSYNYIAGITGAQNKGSNSFKNLTNTGNIISTCQSKMSIGGIAAQLNDKTTAENLINSGSISVSNGLNNSRAGGICGYWGNGATKNVVNSGTVTGTDCGSSFFGGISGVLNVDAQWDGLKSLGAVSANSGNVGYILGGFSAASKTLTVTSDHEFTATVNGDAPTESNAIGYLNGGTLVIQ